MADRAYDFDATRARAILRVATENKMYAEGAIPDSDADAIIAAEHQVAMAMQAKEIAEAGGQTKVPIYASIMNVLFEAQVLVGANPPTENGATPSTSLASSDPSPSSPALPVSSVPPTPAPAGEAQPSSSSESPSSPSESAESTKQLELEARPLEKNSVQLDLNGGEWRVVRDAGPQVEVMSTTGENTLVPRGFLKREKEAGHVDVHVKSADNGIYYTHPGCTSWIVPLDDCPPPIVGEMRECNECAIIFPIASVDLSEYVQPPQQPKEESSASSSAPVSPSSVSAGSGDAEPTPSPSSSPSASSGHTEEAVDTEGDQRYAQIVEHAEKDWAPAHMPVPQDLSSEPLAMPDDPTADQSYNRLVHMQRNALAARARWLMGRERRIAHDLDQAVKLHMPRAMREARAKLGKDATVAEVRTEASEDEQVSLWSVRSDRHKGRMHAYETLFEIYVDDRSTLSRDLTFAGAEERGA